MTEAKKDECPPHEFITLRRIEENFDRKICARCGIQAFSFLEDSKFSIFENGKWVEIEKGSK